MVAMWQNLPILRKVLVGVAGVTMIALGVAMLVLPGPGLVTIALGLAILATEFVWAKSLLKQVRDEIAKRNPLRK